MPSNRAPEPTESNWVTLARILRPHGVRGEVAAEILTDFPERLVKLKSVFLFDGRSEPRRVPVRSCWLSHSRGGQAIFHLGGSDSMADAEKLRGFEVRIPLADRPPLSPGRYYVTDLVGCEVRGREGELLGRVRDVQPIGDATPGAPVMTVDSPHGEWLLPLADEICAKIDVAARRIDVILPSGLLDLNHGS